MSELLFDPLAIEIVYEADVDAGVTSESVTFTVKLELVARMGVPEIVAVAGANVRPEGSWPLVSCHV